MGSTLKPLAEVVDLFCGIGALSHGLKQAGLKIVAGYDTDARCQYAYEKNNEAPFLVRDVAKLTAEDIKQHFSGDVPYHPSLSHRLAIDVTNLPMIQGCRLFEAGDGYERDRCFSFRACW